MGKTSSSSKISHPKAAAGSEPPRIVFVGSDKGGVGKSFVSALVADLMEINGRDFRIVQIDEQDRLPSLFGDRVTTVAPARLDDLRRDPAAIVTAFDPLYSAIERSLEDGVALIVDIGGPQQQLVEEYCGLVDLDADLLEAGESATWLVPATAEPEAMRGAVRTAKAVERVLPSVMRGIVLNGRDGPFRFYPGSPADLVWREGLEPLCHQVNLVKLPAIAPGSWLPFEAAGKRFVDVVAAEISEIQAWTGRSRPAAKVLRGDVAAFIAHASQSFKSLSLNARGLSDEA
ncbi:hypothetical protein OEG84_18300 [Hoeflea sp. G2-23]|uniref:CobQ/CobB/MinD/ParA nucleotide binding domain-containing protein n=1 Tax=Hoeflea algicola TaxID=2983763 RepID=A0ABT3ZCV0_9HYPH|nr:hypothetical protein [Hoeflea algicola]MCY0149605.1 hypothetical protein [Hoeflea algicola]